MQQMLNEYCVFLREKDPSFDYIIFVHSFELFYYDIFAEVQYCSTYKDGKLDIVYKEGQKDGD